MVKITTIQAAHTYGVLDPFMAERRDTKFVPGSLSAGENIVVLPQGGYTDRGGTDDHGRIRRPITKRSDYAVAYPNTMQTAPANGSRFVLAELTFPQLAQITFLDIQDVFTIGPAVSGALIAEWLDGAVWKPFGSPLKIEGENYRGTRRLASGAPGHAGHSSTKFRISIDGTKAPTPTRFAGVAAWTERSENSEGSIRALRSASGDAYQAVLTDNNIDIFHDGVWQASLHLLLPGGQVRLLKVEASYDSALLWHSDMEPQKAIRLGAASEWAIAPVAFEDMPLVDYGATYTNGVDEIQSIRLSGVGGTFDLAFEGEITAATTKSPDDIKAKLEALPNVGAGMTVTGSGDNFDVTFSSPKTRARDVPTMIGTHFETSGLVSIRTTRSGKKGGEPIISPTRGWPTVGRFAMGRLNMFGLRSRSATQLSSVTGQPFSLNAEVDVATAALVYDIADSEGSKIVDAIFGRVLVMFASDAVYYFGNRTLDATKTPEIVRSAAPGIAAGVPPVETDNAILYIEEGGSILRSLNYSELEQNYVADNASVLSAALVKNVVDMTRRAGADRIDADMVVMINGDGTATALTTMRSQEVSGFAPWRTDGRFVAACTDHDNDLWFLVERSQDVRLERFAAGKLLDEAIEVASSGSALLSGLAQFEGRKVWAVVSGSVYGPHVVAGGEIKLDQTVSGSVRVGTWLPAIATDQPVRLEDETRRRAARLKRVVRAEVSVVDTSSLAIACNGGAVVEVPLFANDEIVLDQAPLDRLLTGRAEAEGMHGFSPDGTLTVTQVRPGMLTVRSVTKDVVV